METNLNVSHSCLFRNPMKTVANKWRHHVRDDKTTCHSAQPKNTADIDDDGDDDDDRKYVKLFLTIA